MILNEMTDRLVARTENQRAGGRSSCGCSYKPETRKYNLKREGHTTETNVLYPPYSTRHEETRQHKRTR